MIGVSVLGSTGSIGASTLDVLERHPGRYQAVALTANRDVDGLEAQCLKFRPKLAVMADQASAAELESRLKGKLPGTRVAAGVDGLCAAATMSEADQVMAAIVGAAGLLPTLAAAEAGKRVLLANKEALVVSGHLFMDAVNRHGAVLLPIDSEHNAVFQCMPADFSQGLGEVGVSGILLTASGGPFRTTPLEDLARMTPDEALAHPNWSMGSRISIDSATMVNKAFEVIEAHYLFDIPYERIDVLVHPESTIHSFVAYRDGSVLAELASPDMRIPIQYALTYPRRQGTGLSPLDLSTLSALHLEPLDPDRYPAFTSVLAAAERGGGAPAAINAADEVLVARFLNGEIPFTGIASGLHHVLEAYDLKPASEALTALDRLLEVDRWARRVASEIAAT